MTPAASPLPRRVVVRPVRSIEEPPPPPPLMPDVRLGADFNGPVYDANFDHARLTGQLRRVYDCMVDQHWRTLAEIQAETGDPAASISAQLRHLRKRRFGSFVVEKRPRGDRAHGLWEYRLLPPDPSAPVLPLEEETT